MDEEARDLEASEQKQGLWIETTDHFIELTSLLLLQHLRTWRKPASAVNDSHRTFRRCTQVVIRCYISVTPSV
jgi:hypothetical protein